MVFGKKKMFWEVIFWTIFWGSVAFIALFPGILTYLQAVTAIKKQANAVLVTSIGVLFFMAFYLVMRLEAIEQRQARIIRKMALKDSGMWEKDRM